MTPSTATTLAVDAKGLSALLNDVSVRTIRNWDAAGIIPAPVRVGGKVLWRVEEIRAWLDAGSPDRERWNVIRSVKRR